MIGIPGPRADRESIRVFRETHAGGLILFRRNFSSPEGLKKLLRDLEQALGRRLMIAMDHEGGRVVHLPEGVTAFPSALAFGETGRPPYAARQGKIEAKELRRFGIDLNLAPCLDVLTEDYSPSIGIRSYGRDPECVASFGAGRIRTMQRGGLSACAKHFPGLGPAALDPHLKLPVIRASAREIRKRHLRPFAAAIDAGVHAVMSSHAVYPHLDASDVPATFSWAIITDALRRELGFTGLVLTDDLEMGALRGLASVGDAAVRAVAAGHDMILVCRNGKAQREAHAALVRAYRTKLLDEGEMEASLARIRNFLDKRGARFRPGRPLPEPEGSRLARTVARKAIRVSKARNLLPLAPRGVSAPRGVPPVTVTVIFPRLSTLARDFFIEEELLDERSFLERAFLGRVALRAIELVALEPGDEEIRQACAAARKAQVTVLFCYDAHLGPGGRRLLEAVESATGNCIVVLLRDPYDEIFVSERSACVTAFGFRACQIEAAIAELLGNPQSFVMRGSSKGRSTILG
jgi:beta-N-acetylhexosaminidase